MRLLDHTQGGRRGCAELRRTLRRIGHLRARGGGCAGRVVRATCYNIFLPALVFYSVFPLPSASSALSYEVLGALL